MFLDSSVRSMRTISRRSPTCSLIACMCDSTSGSAALASSASPSTPRACTPMRVTRPSNSTVRAARSTRAFEHGLAAVHERRRPPVGQEPGVVGAQHALEDLGRDHVGQQREVFGRRPRGVGEVGHPQVGPVDPEHRRGQRQVVVLDQHLGAVGRLFGQGQRERAVVLAVGLPLALEPRVEGGRERGVVEQVADEPQGGVGDRVVGPVEDGRGMSSMRTGPVS